VRGRVRLFRASTRTGAAASRDAIRTARGALTAAFAAAILVSCQSAPTGDFTVTQSAAEARELGLGDLSLRLLRLRLSPDRAALAELRAELDRDSELPGMSRAGQARIAALQGEAALLSGDQASAKGFADKAAGLYASEEGVYYIRAALQADPGKRLSVLEEGIAHADVKTRLLCERGEELFKAGRYAEAAQDLDEGLRGLDPLYKELYGSDRERAFALAQAQRESGSLAIAVTPEAMEGPITLRAMVEWTFTQTGLLSALSMDAAPSFEKVVAAVVKADLLLSPDAPADAVVTRKDVAFFLWGIVARMERDPSLLRKYRSKYIVSPVPDVPADSPWFDSVLGVVEREIMDLPDGIEFKPDDPVKGIQYLDALNALSRQYR
jgi:tetratricopeptide (TPR) repeat protein